MKLGVRVGARRGVVIAALVWSAGCGAKDDGTSPGSGGDAGNGAPAADQGGAPATPGTGGAAVPAAGVGGTTAGQGGSVGTPPDGGGGAGAPIAGSGGQGGSGGAAPVGAGGSAGAPPDPGGRSMMWPPVTDLVGDGPYEAVSADSSGPGGGYSLYYPQELGPEGRKHPIVTWGNGATTVPGLFPMLPHLATHGFVVIASNNAFVTGDELRAGLTWLEEQNADSSSMFYQKLDPNNAASMGYSLGSLGTFEIASDPHLVTTVHISGGAMDKAVVPNLKHPAAFFCGDPSDIAHDNCESDFEMASVPVFYGVFPGDHLGILGAFAEPISKVVTGWLRWRLLRDDSLESMFVGPSCTVCMDSGWTVKQKDFDVAP